MDLMKPSFPFPSTPHSLFAAQIISYFYAAILGLSAFIFIGIPANLSFYYLIICSYQFYNISLDSQRYISNQLMSRIQPTARKSSLRKDRLSKSSKENVDSLYLIQNENQVLKRKNIQMVEAISDIKAELSHRTSILAQNQQDCQYLRTAIQKTEFTDDIRLEGEKKMLNEKIQLTKGHYEIVSRKIEEIRANAIYEEQKIPNIKEDRRVLEKELWEAKTENEGTKIVLINLENELERNRADNELLVSKRKEYGPKQSEFSKEIQERLRLIKSRQGFCSSFRKQQSARIMQLLIQRLELSFKKQAIMSIEKSGLFKETMKKRVFMLSLIRRKYLLFVKNAVLQKFRQSFRPLEQQERYRRIVQQTKERRTKHMMFRIWRSETNKKQYITTRYFEVQNTLQKISDSIQTSNLFATFNLIKYLGRNPLHQRAVTSIDSICAASYRRNVNLFFSSLIAAANAYLDDQQIEVSAREQSIVLVLSLYFGNWAKLTKDNKATNLSLKFKYFRELKKLRALKRKRNLSEMLAITNEKINQINTASAVFCNMKEQTAKGLLASLEQEKKETDQKCEHLSSDIKSAKQENKEQFQMFSILKVSKYLKKQEQKAFDIWRTLNGKVNNLKAILTMLNSKFVSDLNFGFAKIQKRRFQKLKVSISEKIESCEFSYNYLVKENAHIKEVLDTKLIELEKAKFVQILHKLNRGQKEIMHRYFFKFLHSGYKCWNFKKSYQRVDEIIEKRVKVAAMFMFKFISQQNKQTEIAEKGVERKVAKIEFKMKLLSFKILERLKNRNKFLKRVLENIFVRNLELNLYNGYNKVKQIYLDYKVTIVDQANAKVEAEIQQLNKNTESTEDTIQMLRDRLSSKEGALARRKILACRKILVKNSSNRYIFYINRWRNKVEHEKKVKQFAEILERKTRVMVKNRMAFGLIRNYGQQEISELKGRLANFKADYDDSSSAYDRFVEDSEGKMLKMEKQSEVNIKQGKILQSKTDHMDDIKIKSFHRYWGKMICRFAFREWKIQKEEFLRKWKKAYEILASVSRKFAFLIVSEEMREEILKNRIKKNLSSIYSKKYRHNAGLAFNIWRLTNLSTKIKEYSAAFGVEVNNFETITQKSSNLDVTYDSCVNFRIEDRKLRKIFDFLKKYTRKKLKNNAKKQKLEVWLKRNYQSQFYNLFKKRMAPLVQNNKRADNFYNSKPVQKEQKLFYALKQIIRKKKIIKKLFLGKFIYHAQLKLNEQFFTRTKNYIRFVEVNKKSDRTFRVQKMIETFEKNRKNILCRGIRVWRKNQYEMSIGRKLFKRLTRKAIYNRYQGMFYAWKLESQAKGVVKYHSEEGEIKKRKHQIQRLDRFLQEFKKDKGLLLENEEGNFVMSPRFQKKKQEDDRKDKNLRYKFISRLIMSINGYGAPIRAYNNLQIYMKLRQKYRKSSLFVLNHLRRPDMLLAFRAWNKATAQFRQDFNTMDRKQLIKVLNRQKDKMEIEYSHKLEIDQMIETEFNRFKVFSHQRDKKERLCAYILSKSARKVKGSAFAVWRDRKNQLQQRQAHLLAQRGEVKIQEFEEELRQLQEMERQMQESNSKLKQAVYESLQIAEMVKKISSQRDKLSHLIQEKHLTCESLLQENQALNSKLYLAQKEAMNLLIISGEAP